MRWIVEVINIDGDTSTLYYETRQEARDAKEFYLCYYEDGKQPISVKVVDNEYR